MTAAPQLAMELALINTTISSSRKRPPMRTWDAHDFDSQRMLQLMMGPHMERASGAAIDQASVETLDLFGSGGVSGGTGGDVDGSGGFTPPGRALELEDNLELDSASRLPTGWEKCLDLKTGSIYYLNRSTGLSTYSDPRKARTSTVNWPASPSSSSDVTVEASSSSGHPTEHLQLVLDHALDLNLSLKPTSTAFPPSSKGSSHITHHSSMLNHSLRSLITSQTLVPISQSKAPKQMGALDCSLLHLNNSKTSGTFLTCISSSTVSSSPSPSSSLPSTISVRELDALKDTRRPNNAVTHNNEHEVDIRNYLIGKESSINCPMMTVGCANCLMFVMLPRSGNPKCPRCGASIDCDLPQAPMPKKPRQQIALL